MEQLNFDLTDIWPSELQETQMLAKSTTATTVIIIILLRN